MLSPLHIRPHLLRIEEVLRSHQRWQLQPPPAVCLHSEQPFCLDTLAPEQWLQWIFLPRFHYLLDTHAPVPDRMALTPYFEHSLDSDSDVFGPLIAALADLDALFGNHAE